MNSKEQNASDTTAITTADKHDKSSIITTGAKGVQLQSFDDMWRFSRAVVAGGFAPKGMEKPETVLIALQMGLEVGLSPMASLQNIAVINGRPAIWGDAVPGLVRGSGLQESYSEEEIGTYPNDDYGFRVTSKRKDDPMPIITTFTVADAKEAGLWGKVGPWKQYPKRMLKMRARTFNQRDNFPDVLKGVSTVEEARDIREAEYTVEGDNRTATDKLADMIAVPEETERGPAVNIETGEVVQPEIPLDNPVSEPVNIFNDNEA